MFKIAVIGAGQVGACIGYTLALTGCTGEIDLIDVNAARARGEAMDIAHGMPLYPPVEVKGGGYELLDGADLALVTAGVNQLPGQTRRDLAGKNWQIVRSIARELLQRAPQAIVVMIVNPVDVLTRAMIYETGFPPRQVFGSGTVLDTLRLRAMLSRHTDIDPRNIHGFVLGEHGDSELPAWSTVSISGMTMEEYCQECGQCDGQLPQRMRQAFDGQVRRAAYQVIEQKGATNYAIALAVRRIVQAVTRDELSILTVSSLLTEEYGISDVCLSLPCVVGRHGVEKRIPVKLTPEEEVMLRHSADVVRSLNGVPQYSGNL